MIHAAHALTFDRIIEYKEVSYRSGAVPAELDGYRIAFICDIHALPTDKLAAVVERLNALQVDLLALGGDYPRTGGAPMRTMEILSHAEAPDGIYGVEGNHDNFRNVIAAMVECGIMPLSNSGARARDGLYIAGVEDLWRRTPDIEAAVSGAQSDDFVLLLAHNPDITMLQDAAPADLVLSGHTHGGQITFFGVWAPYFTVKDSITRYGQRFRSGWARSRDDVPVYVSNGIGEYMVRVFARPQVIIITLKHV
ncbi:MAG: metallophosphoesterase [Oscillospiraceae bacterium]|nr:metallophosphoesterase [Oscillospiraceae bacterium]